MYKVMLRCFRYISVLAVAMVVPFLLFPASASGQCQEWAGKAVSVQGEVQYQKSGNGDWLPVGQEEVFCPGDTVRVGENSRADLLLRNQSVMRLNEKTSFVLEAVEQEGRPLVVNMLRGAAHFFSRKPRSLDVKTPYTIAGVRGTEFYIAVGEDRTDISVFEGMVQAQNQHGSLELASGQSAVAPKGQAPAYAVMARPRDAVNWALYYPPIGAGPDASREVQRASELLAVGQVDKADALLDQALEDSPRSGQAYALKAIIALVQNNRQQAGELADRAVQLSPGSAAPWIAASYVQQSRFELDQARASLQSAVKAEPSSALARALLAESWTMSGNLDKALEEARQAVEIDPDLAITQKVLGFVYLKQVKTGLARLAFQRAIELDQADPMPRLGMGLAEIRDGNLQEGQSQIEIAASLDPNRSLIRSYLGKVFYEEKRTDLALTEYQIARELDPNDPTPWFYGAVAKQTTNRPVQAMQDYQKAIELNDNRAVYRSRLLLDSDLAARSAALGRLYSELGFEQLALEEGWKAVTEDPSNYSAHRFLADTYATLPRHEIARVSALLQSQLLQPINLTPIQPRLAESNLFLISSLGPSSLSFSEFNPLFERRQRVAFLGSGMVGENDTYAGEGVVSGVHNKLSLSGGYTHFETDGWRENAQQEDDIYNLFAQYELSHNTSLQVELRSRDLERGDTELTFFEDDFRRELDQDQQTTMARFGIRHDIHPGHTLLGHFSFQDNDYEIQDIPPGPVTSFESDSEVDSYTGELSYHLRSDRFNIVAGGGYVDVSEDLLLAYELNLPPPPMGPGPISVVSESDGDIEHANAYVYSSIDLHESLMLVLGASGDFYDTSSDEMVDEDQFNPKLGFIWTPRAGTTVRGAAFRTFTRTLPTDQTLEPTQVAGFNQFFDDVGGTDAWRYGLGVDQRITDGIYAGAEYSKRELEVPYLAATMTGVALDTVDWDEESVRSYVYWTPHDWVSVTAEAFWELHERDEEFGVGLRKLETWWFPLGVNLFHPCGLSASLKATYYDQEGSFNRLEAPPDVFEDGSDSFWLVDAALQYRFPKRHGFLTVGVKNLFDEEFQYHDVDYDNPRIEPERFVFARITLALP